MDGDCAADASTLRLRVGPQLQHMQKISPKLLSWRGRRFLLLVVVAVAAVASAAAAAEPKPSQTATAVTTSAAEPAYQAGYGKCAFLGSGCEQCTILRTVKGRQMLEAAGLEAMAEVAAAESKPQAKPNGSESNSTTGNATESALAELQGGPVSFGGKKRPQYPGSSGYYSPSSGAYSPSSGNSNPRTLQPRQTRSGFNNAGNVPFAGTPSQPRRRVVRDRNSRQTGHSTGNNSTTVGGGDGSGGADTGGSGSSPPPPNPGWDGSAPDDDNHHYDDTYQYHEQQQQQQPPPGNHQYYQPPPDNHQYYQHPNDHYVYRPKDYGDQGWNADAKWTCTGCNMARNYQLRLMPDGTSRCGE